MPIIIGDSIRSDLNDPLGLLTDCHRRIEKFVTVLHTLAEQDVGENLDAERREALRVSLRYFRESAPKHAADEEDSLFPRMLARAGSEIAGMLEALNSDHRSFDDSHKQVEELGRSWLANDFLKRTEATRLRMILIDMREKYARHIGIEERNVFPLAGRILPPEELQVIAYEMAQRRGLEASSRR
jgi:hemerythrin-like domain-containing protein